MLICDGEDQLQSALGRVQQVRANDPDRHRPAPTAVQRFEIYGTAPSAR